MFLSVKCDRSAYCPVDADYAARSEFGIERRSFTDQSETVSFLHKHLHLGWMSCCRKLLDDDPGIPEKAENLARCAALRIMVDCNLHARF